MNKISYLLYVFLIACLSILFSNTHTLAQSKSEVSGTVTDARSGESLPGVNVLVKGTTMGTSTDSEGEYELNVSSLQDTLVFSFVGYQSQEVPVDERMEIDIALQPQAIAGEELVVVGYGKQQKSDLTGSISSVSQEEFNQGITTNPEELIQGKAAGVQITQRSGDPNASTVVNIRGVGSLRSGTSPLYVVDGIPLSGTADFLDSQDIESIDVLKDASATAIYGAREANGVILITTKKGHQGEPTLTYNGYVSISNAESKLDLLTAREFIDFQNEFGDPSNVYSANNDTDWQNQFFRTAYSQNHVLSYSGGLENTTYRASLNYKNQEGIILDSRRHNYNGSLSLDQSFLDDRLTINTNLHGIFIRADHSAIENDAGVGGDLLSSATTANPTFPTHNEDGSLFAFPNGINPLLSSRRNTDFTEQTRILGNIQATLEIMEGLEYSARFSADKSTINGVSQVDRFNISSGGSADIGNPEGRLVDYNEENINYAIEQDLTYQFNVEDHSFKLLGGYSYQKFDFQTRTWSINNFSTDEIDAYRNPGIGTDINIDQNRPGGSAYINKLQSFYGRINYNFRSTYFLTSTLRADGSSKFGEDKKYGLFPSFSVGWRLSDEAFLSGFETLSNLKIRAGWGQTGNQDIPPYITHQLLSVETGRGQGYFFDEVNIPGISFVRAQNQNLHWETSSQTNIGLDFGFFEDRVSGTIDVYNKISSDILFESSTSTDPIAPASSFWRNYDMEIQNRGLELSLEYRQPVGTDFSFNIGGNVSFIDNNVTGLPVQILNTGAISGQGLSGVTVNGILNDYPVGTFYLQDWIGLDENGMNMFRDVNGDGDVNADDNVTAGSAVPKSTFGGFIKLFYKNLDLSLNFNGVYGNKLYWNDENAYYAYPRLAGGINSLRSVADFGGEESIGNSATPSTRWLHDASYIRLNNATLGYNVSTSAVSWVKNLRVYITGQNLFVITSYPGYDPEVDTNRSVAGFRSFGIDGTSFPRARTFSLGINLSL